MIGVDRSSRQADLVKNAGGSVDLYFGPRPARGQEQRSVVTVPGSANVEDLPVQQRET